MSPSLRAGGLSEPEAGVETGSERRGQGIISNGVNNTTPTNNVYGAMQDGYVERFDQKISPRPSFPKRGITISSFGKGGIRGIL